MNNMHEYELPLLNVVVHFKQSYKSRYLNMEEMAHDKLGSREHFQHKRMQILNFQRRDGLVRFTVGVLCYRII
jgi:hypothetical protein